jgi:hypothetical protein
MNLNESEIKELDQDQLYILLNRLEENLDEEEKAKYFDTLEQIRIQLARKDSNYFTEYVMRDEDGDPITQGTIHEEWHEEFNRDEPVLLIAPRFHGKTTQIVAFVLWKIGKNPNLRIKIVCQSDGNAKKRLKEIKEYITDSDAYTRVFPHVKPHPDVDDWSKHSVTIDRETKSKDSTIEAWGVNSSATGGRADMIVYDDICDLRSSIQQPKMRKQVKQSFKNTWSNMIGPGGKSIYIGTVWHEDDMTSELMEGDAYRTSYYAIDEDMTPIWPAKWDRPALKQKKDEIGKRAFDRAFRNKAVSDDEKEFSEEALENIQGQFDVADILNRFSQNNIYIGMDLAIGENASSNYSTVFVVLRDPDKRRRVIDIRRGRWKASRIIEEIIEINKLYNPVLFMVENNSFQEVIIDWAKSMNKDDVARLPIQGFTTGSQKVDPEVGIPSLAVEMEQGKWVADYDREAHKKRDCECNLCVWYEELEAYPFGANTDTVMANWFVLQAIREGPVDESEFDQQAQNINDFLRQQVHAGQDMLRGVIDQNAFY